jgi:hypothetical protein
MSKWRHLRSWLRGVAAGLFKLVAVMVVLWCLGFVLIWIAGVFGVSLEFKFADSPMKAFLMLLSVGAFLGMVIGGTDGILRPLRLSVGLQILLGCVVGALHGALLAFITNSVLFMLSGANTPALLILGTILGACFGAGAHGIMNQMS